MNAKEELVTNVLDEMPVSSDQFVPYGAPRRIQHSNNERKFQLPLEFWGGSALEFNLAVDNVVHEANGATVPSLMLDEITILYVTHRLYWETGNGAEYQTSKEYQGDGWKSRLQVFCILKEADDFLPCVLTVGSLTAEATERAIMTALLRTKTMLKRIGYGDRDERMFWITLAIPRAPVSASNGEKQKNIYPPVALAPADMYKMSKQDIASYLTGTYVGKDDVDIFEGLQADGREWAERPPVRLMSGNGNVALPPAMTEAVVLDDGSLHIPDLSEAKERTHIDCAMSIPGLFNARNHAERASAKILRAKHLGRASKAVRWDAWKTELIKRWDDLQALNDSQNRVAESRGLVAQGEQEVSEMSAMDEVEDSAADEDDYEVPEEFL